jgi:oligogalacturonide transport system permease protein
MKVGGNPMHSKVQTLHNKGLFRKENFGLLCVMPWVIGFAVLNLYPFITSFVLSFTNSNVLHPAHFVGLQNYIYMFTKDPEYVKSLILTLIYSFVSVPLKLAFALFIAMLLNQQLKHIGFFRTVYYIPSIIGSSVAMAATWRGLFSYNGIINSLLAAANLPTVPWLSDPVAANSTLILMTVWQFGSSMVIFLAGLKAVPETLYEAARIDSANGVQAFFKITLPILSPVIFFNLIMQSIGALQEFTGPYLITNGGPMKFTYLYGLKLYEEGFKYFKMGYASAMSWVLFIIIFILTLLTFRSSDKWVYYEDGGKS